MGQFIEGVDRHQAILLPEYLDDYVDEDSPVRAIDAFIDKLDLAGLGFQSSPAATGRPGYHPGLMLCIYLYGYLNQIQSSRRLERECGRNLELICRRHPHPISRGAGPLPCLEKPRGARLSNVPP